MIARRYGVKLDALMAANPKLDPRRLQIGQAVIIPAP
jgi:LysM repeat protein